MELILQHFQALTNWESLAELRLVSKSWHAAFKEHAAKPEIWLIQGQPNALKRLCDLHPNMLDLTVRTSHPDISLLPIEGCSHLTSLNVQGDCCVSDVDEVNLNLAFVPPSVTRLKLDEVSLAGTCFDDLKCLHLTSLDWMGIRRLADMYALLPLLPALEVVSW